MKCQIESFGINREPGDFELPQYLVAAHCHRALIDDRANAINDRSDSYKRVTLGSRHPVIGTP